MNNTETIPPGSLERMVGLREALREREAAKQKVLTEVKQHTERGELVKHGQMPSWPEYTAACLRVENLEAEIVRPNAPAHRAPDTKL